jgi:FkbM family methyltransferase
LNKARNVTIVAAACSDAPALATFSSGPNFATGHLVAHAQWKDGTQEGTFPVATVTVDAIVQQLGVSPDVIKIDVEGAEASVLAGAQVTLRETKPKIFLSTHSEMLRSTCLEHLTELGYTSKVLSQDKNSPSEFLAEYTGV